MTANLLELWCRDETTAAVWAYMAPLVAGAGFEGPLLASDDRDRADPTVYSWEALRLGDERVFVGIEHLTEGCVAFSLAVRRPGGHPALLALWDALLRAPPPWMGECILMDRTAGAFPLLIHSFTRLQPMTAMVGDEDGSWRRVVAGDATYWREVGRRLHFLADGLLAPEGTPTAEEIAASLGARLDRVTGGVVLDCGWTSPDEG